MSVASVPNAIGARRSPFAGAEVCHAAGFQLPPGTPGPVFDQGVWDFTAVVGLPVHLHPHQRRLDFTTIANPHWCLVAKELILALLAPRHQAVALLPRALRTPLHLRTCSGRLAELTRWLNWLTAQDIARLDEVDNEQCEAYLAHRREVRDEHGAVIGERSPATRRAAVQTIVDLLNYRELFTTDRLRAGLRPWSGASPSAVAGMRSGREGNKTAPLQDRVLQPVLAAALYLTDTLGPYVVDLARSVREADRTQARPQFAPVRRIPTPQLTAVLRQHARERVPLALLAEPFVRRRLTAGWQPHDPLLRVNLNALARAAGITQFHHEWIPPLRDLLQATLAEVGLQAPWARAAAQVPRADDHEQVPWTLPLHREEVGALAGVVRTACILVTAAVSGMRACELMELVVGCRQPPEEVAPGLVRYRLAGKLIKGQPLGGVRDEWVVIQPVYRAVELAEQLLDDFEPGVAVFGRFAFDIRYQWLRAWVNGPAGQRLGLAPIPQDPAGLRALRRTLALELAHRPGGLLAAKLHLKHISVATTEGYAARPGGAQAELLTEVNRHETKRNLELVLAEFRNYQQGILPAGPGAPELAEFFASVDAKLESTPVDAPKVQRSDREVLNLLTKRAQALHLGVGNYCWFTDPSRALCLKLAGTPTATKPLAGMCDSARCPQATHHPCHRPVWAEHAQQTKTFLGNLGPPARPNGHACRPTTTAPYASWPPSTPPPDRSSPDMRISAAQRHADQQRIRTVMDRLLRGEVPPGGRCDIKTLAAEASVDRTAFYGTRPYAPLRVEFEQRLQALQRAGTSPDPREAQITRLKAEVTALKERLTQADHTIAQLSDLRGQAMARLAAQHDEITRLRDATVGGGRVTRLPRRGTGSTIGPCS